VQVFGWRARGGGLRRAAADGAEIRATKKRFVPPGATKTIIRATKKPAPQKPQNFGAHKNSVRLARKFRGHFPNGPENFWGHFDFGAIGVCENLIGKSLGL
jgi:hypothetical protein